MEIDKMLLESNLAEHRQASTSRVRMPRGAEYRRERQANRERNRNLKSCDILVKAEPPLEGDQEKYLFGRLRSLQKTVAELQSSPRTKFTQSRIVAFMRRSRVIRDHLNLANLRLVASIAKKQKDWDHDRDELMSVGSIAVLEAIDRFDPTRGTRFSTYATKAIKNAFHDRYRRSGTKRLTNVADCSAFAEDAASLEVGSSARRNGQSVPSARLYQVEDDDEAFNPAAVLVDMFRDLPDRDVEILGLRFALDGGEAQTLEAVGLKLGITKQRVRAIEGRSITFLRERAQDRQLAIA